MRVLITGNMGYVGPVLVRFLRHHRPDWTLLGFDAGFFALCLTGTTALPERFLNAQLFGDVRELPPEALSGVDAVVQLAAVSNDPMGNRFEEVTRAVNQDASVRLARLARGASVRRFVFASSCSVYGAAEGGPRKETDPKNPLTAYARSKIDTEEALLSLNLEGMTLTNLRFATACGMSDRLRLDLVLNDFVACALSSGEITVQSDGTPWRPLIDVEDMARAILWALERPEGESFSVNAGSSRGNYQVKDLAEAVAAQVPGTRVSINPSAPPDKRSYQVDFSLFEKLAAGYAPQVSLEQSIARLVEGFKRMNFSDKNFRNSQFMRLKVLEQHIQSKALDAQLRWTS